MFIPLSTYVDFVDIKTQFFFDINQSPIISYITAPKVVTSHQGWSVLSSAWWWPPLERLPNSQAFHWTPSWPLDQGPHVDVVDINFSQWSTCNFFLKKTVEILLELNTPRGAFFLFSWRENVGTGTFLVAMAGTQRCMPCVPAVQKLCGAEKSFRFVVPVLSFFPPCFLRQYIFFYGRK